MSQTDFVMWLLTIEDDEGTTLYHRLARERYTVGRASDNDFVLAQLDVSRRHARFESAGDGWQVVDEGSDNGTFVNGRPAEGATRLASDDVVQIGSYRLSFSEGDSAGDPTPAPRYVPPARVRVLAGPAAGTEHVFARDEVVTLGRSDDCSVRLLHEKIISVHAMICPLPDGRYEVVDTSGEGLVVNGLPITRQVLEGGDAINLAGVALLRYLEPSQASDPRFDELAPGGLAAPPEVAEEALKGDAVAVGPSGRFEAVGPRPVPGAPPEPASFKAARNASVRLGGHRHRGGRAIAAGRGAGQATAGRSAGASQKASQGADVASGAVAAEGAGAAAGEGASNTDSNRPWWPLAEIEDEPAPLLVVPGAPPSPPKAAPARTGAAPAPRVSGEIARRRELMRLVALSLLAMAVGLASASLILRKKASETMAVGPEGDAAVATGGRVAPPGSVRAMPPDEAPEGGEAAGEVVAEVPAALGKAEPAVTSAPPASGGGRGQALPVTTSRGGNAAWARKQRCWKQEGGPCVDR